MKILAISDTHGTCREFPNINPDLVLLLGDIEFYEIRKIEKFYTCPIVGILGNHDVFDYFEDTRVKYIHQQVIEINGLKIAGFNGSVLYKKKGHLQYSEEEVYEFIKNLGQVDIFIAHSNPMTEETKSNGIAHRGFVSLTHYITTKKPKIFLHGHIHESKEYEIEDNRVISVYPFKEFTFNNT